MCRAITCKRCGRPDWRGCGQHVDAVLGHVPTDQRCRCREGGPVEATSSATSVAGGEPTKVSRWWRR